MKKALVWLALVALGWICAVLAYWLVLIVYWTVKVLQA